MPIKGGIIERGGVARSSHNFNKPDCLRWSGVAVQFSTDAKGELWVLKLDAHEIIDMLDNPVKCPKYRKFQKEETEGRELLIGFNFVICKGQ
jgi:hypothetical protein